MRGRSGQLFRPQIEGETRQASGEATRAHWRKVPAKTDPPSPSDGT